MLARLDSSHLLESRRHDSLLWRDRCPADLQARCHPPTDHFQAVGSVWRRDRTACEFRSRRTDRSAGSCDPSGDGDGWGISRGIIRRPCAPAWIL